MATFERVHWDFMNRDTFVIKLGEKVAYSLTCLSREHDAHEIYFPHSIECLWIWHDCDMSIANDAAKMPGYSRADYAMGWKPSGVSAHKLVSIEPLHIEPSIYWLACCGMHGFIRDGKWEGV
jgi:hypothetical protein